MSLVHPGRIDGPRYRVGHRPIRLPGGFVATPGQWIDASAWPRPESWERSRRIVRVG